MALLALPLSSFMATHKAPNPVTLDTLPFCSPQEVFDFIAFNLLKQNKKCKNGEFGCYHNREGLKDAAGFLMGEDEHFEHLDSHSWMWLVENGYAPREHYKLIIALQNLHDYRPVHTWRSGLEKIAEKLNLNVDILGLF